MCKRQSEYREYSENARYAVYELGYFVSGCIAHACEIPLHPFQKLRGYSQGRVHRLGDKHEGHKDADGAEHGEFYVVFEHHKDGRLEEQRKGNVHGSKGPYAILVHALACAPAWCSRCLCRHAVVL